MPSDIALLVGEIYVDFTVATNTAPVKMRLGGVVHAARGLWACNIRYAVAAICPSYLTAEAEAYLRAHGCEEFFVVGHVDRAPNVIVIGDAREVAHQGYEDILRHSKTVENIAPPDRMSTYRNVVVFPGAYDIARVSSHLGPDTSITIDIAYGVQSVIDTLTHFKRLSAVVISTSSDLFLSFSAIDINGLLDLLRPFTQHVLLKENRGGSRLFHLDTDKTTEIPAMLGETANSVGVGDVYTAVFSAFSLPPDEAAWRGMQVATRYAQTTFPDDFKRDVQRDLNLELSDLRSLEGVSLPWHVRPSFQIYLAAPDFSYLEKPEVDAAVAALKYHNFVVRRPIVENGQAQQGASPAALQSFFDKDVSLLNDCAMIFGVPLRRDPGTLVEMGMAMALRKPVVTFDPRRENQNTMVVCGSRGYSDDLDHCLNATFDCLSRIRKSAA